MQMKYQPELNDKTLIIANDNSENIKQHDIRYCEPQKGKHIRKNDTQV